MKYSGHPLHSKLPDQGVTIFTRMTQLAQEYAAINLAQGFPNFMCDADLVAKAAKFMQQGHNQYAPMMGVQPLREQIATQIQTLYGANYDPNTEITITSGATEALFNAIASIIHEGDEVIILEPCYDSYVPAVKLAGGRPKFVPLDPETFAINWTSVRKSISQKTKAIILNSPHNPTGKILCDSDIQELIKIIEHTDIVIVADEVYEFMVFDGATHKSMCRYPELASRSFVISSFGKSLHITGWKIGYCVAPKQLTTEFRKVHQFNTFSTATPLQLAIYEYITQFSTYSQSVQELYQQKRNFFKELLAKTILKVLPCEGTYFLLASFKTKEFAGKSDMEFVEDLTKRQGVAAIPLSAFYYNRMDNKLIRLCFAKTDELLIQAVERLQQL